ncbi:MAG: CDP-glycerol glycerophosphotransferase family protein [Bacillota bacterium]|nr:CDP-glycerol glycerophosphotransferase family protein [Bacillota bacterium]
MVRELLIDVYLLFYKIFFSINNLFPLKNKIIFIITFEENAIFLYKEILKQKIDVQIVFLCNTSILSTIKENCPDAKISPLNTLNIFSWLISVYNIATSKVILVDNYFAFLSTMNFKRGVTCIQLWHAAGALKKFGLQDKKNERRSKRAIKRFQKVYSKFDRIIVGSKKMEKIFNESFEIPFSKMLRTGIPRTDFFFDENLIHKTRMELKSKISELGEKKVIMYAPTFRSNELKNQKVELDIKMLYENLKDDFIILLKFHPLVQNQYEFNYSNFIYNMSDHKNINELLLVTDYLITDYSSIPFEYSLLKKPMIFFVYDYTYYKNHQGIVDSYKQIIPGPIAKNTEEVLNCILSMPIENKDVTKFSEEWNQYSTGKSSKNLATYIRNQLNNNKK